MGICKERDHRGRVRFVVSKYWPHGSGRLRKYAPNHKAAQRLLNRVETAILDGRWRDLKAELEGNCDVPSVEEFCRRFLNEYCKTRLRSWKRYELSFKSLNKHLGNVLLRDFRRELLHKYVRIRTQEVSPGTVNRDIAAISKMFSYALECGLVETHPLVKFPKLKQPEKSFQPISLLQFHALVEVMPEKSLQALIAVMGETGIRLQEALKLKWRNVDLQNRIVTLEETKNGKVRQVPLSDYAVSWLSRLVHYIKRPYVFISKRSGDRWCNPTKPFKEACKKVGITIGFHDLRRFRTTRWLMSGVDVRTVKELLGHSEISTTMRYASVTSFLGGAKVLIFKA